LPSTWALLARFELLLHIAAQAKPVCMLWMSCVAHAPPPLKVEVEVAASLHFVTNLTT